LQNHDQRNELTNAQISIEVEGQPLFALVIDQIGAGNQSNACAFPQMVPGLKIPPKVN
jgi:hypothetical protein